MGRELIFSVCKAEEGRQNRNLKIFKIKILCESMYLENRLNVFTFEIM